MAATFVVCTKVVSLTLLESENSFELSTWEEDSKANFNDTKFYKEFVIGTINEKV